ncbi:glycosyltransferase [Algibacter mikhailovii]|uniref:Glycosyl transferase family 1 domain-containing protein n=1 Tax=Algibacter mikhailovii TaxID=425498 RepID=A0A918RCV7_9FLAO|nr:glycosyltransferase [Algibacter mikhailovii]GGZ93597.1 hypothetical protein GCM10007028_35010 [Algibacter mikhailovii]
MNILFINNAGFLRDNGSVFMTRTTGVFANQVEKQLNQKINFFQFVEDGQVSSGINDYQINNDQIKTVFFRKGNKKMFSYISVFLKILFFKHEAKLTYIFFPGNVSTLFAWKCFLFNKPYGLYIRGEYNKALSKPLIRKAKFVNTVGLVFKKDIDKINSNCHLIKPMVLYDFTKPLSHTFLKKRKEILFVGRIETDKGIWEILEAAKTLIKVLPDYQIRLIGSGNDASKVEDFIKQNNLNNVILHGPVYDPIKLKVFYLNATLFLFPSYHEGFPRVIYEALYFKLPVITTFVGNISGIMENKINCLKIETKSAQSIVKQVERLANDKSLQQELIKNGDLTLHQIFNSDIKSHSELFTSQFLSL